MRLFGQGGLTRRDAALERRKVEVAREHGDFRASDIT
jgi:hypothetical protein